MKILVIDDEVALAELLAQRLENSGHKCMAVYRGEDGFQAAGSFRPEAILCDLFLPDVSGMDLMPRLRLAHPGIPIVMMTGAGNSKLAVQAMKAGAESYLEKPIEFEELSVLLEKIQSRILIQGELESIKSGRRDEAIADLDILAGAAMKRIYEEIERVASMDRVTVLISGETGTGKEHVARLLHRLSSRSGKPFVEFNCAAFPDNLAESEIFGYEAGAFTDAKKAKKGLLEAAQGGTVFLDEVGELSPAVQAKLLKVLEDKEARRVGGLQVVALDIRIVAASNRDLAREAAEGRFRPDLFYRLNVFPIALPPLRERGGDARRLARFFFDKACIEFGRKMEPLSEEALQIIEGHSWPGNVRELKNVVDGLVIRSRQSAADLAELRRLLGSLSSPEAPPQAGAQEEDDPASGMKDALERQARALKRRMIVSALERCHGNKSEAARFLKVDYKTLYNLIKELDIAAPAA